MSGVVSLLFLGRNSSVEDIYQLDATRVLLRTLIRFDFGLCLTFGVEDLFFFFWSSRPIFIVML